MRRRARGRGQASARSSSTSSGETLPARQHGRRCRGARGTHRASAADRAVRDAPSSSSSRTGRGPTRRAARLDKARSRATSRPQADEALRAARRRSTAGVRARTAAAGRRRRPWRSSSGSGSGASAGARRRGGRGRGRRRVRPDGGRPSPGSRRRLGSTSASGTRSRAATAARDRGEPVGRAARRSGRAARASARPGPGPPPGAAPTRARRPAGRRRAGPRRAASGASASPWSARIASTSRGPTGPRRSRAQRDRIVGRSGSSASAHRMMVTPAGGSSSVLSSAAWASSFIRSARLDDGDPGSALDRQQRQLADQVADAADRRSGSADDDLAAGTLGPEPMEVRVGAVLDQPARAARAGRGRSTAAAVHRSPAARSSASVVLPTPAGPTSRTACGRRTPDHGGDRGERGRMSPGPGAVHADGRPGRPSGGFGRATFRVERRFGAAATGRRRRRTHLRRPEQRPWPPSRPPACGSPAAWQPAPGGIRRRGVRLGRRGLIGRHGHLGRAGCLRRDLRVERGLRRCGVLRRSRLAAPGLAARGGRLGPPPRRRPATASAPTAARSSS